jgi:RNA recognition motif-containing protein
MAINIYVGNLPWSTTDAELRDMFAQFGQVIKAQVITDRDTGRSRGFGFVEMPTEEDAQRAIDALNNQPMGGRPLTVNIARPREPRAGGGGGGYGGGGYGGGGGRGGYGGGGGGRGGYGGGGGGRGGYGGGGGGYGGGGGGYSGGGDGDDRY